MVGTPDSELCTSSELRNQCSLLDDPQRTLDVVNNQLTGSVRIRPLDISDAPELAEAYVANRGYLQPWEPVHPDGFYTVGGQQDAVDRCLAVQADSRGFFWVLVDGPSIVGRVSLSNVVGGAFLSSDVGYWVAEEYQGRGLASAAVEVVSNVARESLGLHRIQAGTVVNNVASQRVLERCSFTMIGLAPQYLHINGEWQDHLLFQRILHD